MPRSAAATVHKFGGASLADGRAMRHALALVARGPRPAAVVVSAMAGVTDALLGAARRLSRGDDTGVRAIVAELGSRYLAAARAVCRSRDARRRLSAAVRSALGELDALCRAPLFLRELSPATLDHLLSRGEELAARVFAAGLAA